MAGTLAARGEVRQSCCSTTGGPFPAWVGSFGSTCTAHAHTRARAHARARPRCTLQNTFPQHCTSTTTAHFCPCTLTCASVCGSVRAGAAGFGLCQARARGRGSRPPIRRQGPLRGLQPPTHEAAWRFATALQSGGMGAMEARPSDHAACDGFLVLHWLRMPARRPRVGASAAYERVVSRAFALCLLVEVV